MNVKELKEKVSKVFNEPYTSQVYLVLRKETEFTIRIADIEDQTEPEIRKLFSNELKSKIIEDNDFAIYSLSTADEHPNAIYMYDYESYPEELEIFRNFDISKAVDYPKFNFTEDNLSEIFGYIIYLGSMEKGILLFKKHYPISLIKRGTFLLGIRRDDERFCNLSSDDIIRFNGVSQMMRIENEIYVLDVKMLERNMGFMDLINKAAGESVAAILGLDILEDVEVLKDSLEEPSFARKMSKIKQTSPIFSLNIDATTILNFTKETKALAGKFKYSEDGSKIRLDTKKSKNAFLLLMNDGFLHSELTKRYYEALAKDKIS